MIALVTCQSPFACGRCVPFTVDDSLLKGKSQHGRDRLLNRIAAGIGFMTVGAARYCAECFTRSEARSHLGAGTTLYARARQERGELLRIEEVG